MHLKTRQMLAKVLILMMGMQILGLYPKEVAYAQETNLQIIFSNGVYIQKETGEFLDISTGVIDWLSITPDKNMVKNGEVSGSAIVCNLIIEDTQANDVVYVNLAMPTLYEEINGNKIAIANLPIYVFQSNTWIPGGTPPSVYTPPALDLNGTGAIFNLAPTQNNADLVEGTISSEIFIKSVDGKVIRGAHFMNQQLDFIGTVKAESHIDVNQQTTLIIINLLNTQPNAIIQLKAAAPTFYAGVGGQLVPLYFKLVFNGANWEVQTAPVNVTPDNGNGGGASDSAPNTGVVTPVLSESEKNETAAKDELKALTEQLKLDSVSGGAIAEKLIQSSDKIIETIDKLSPERTLQQLETIKTVVEGLGNLLNQEINDKDKEEVKNQIQGIIKTVLDNVSRQPIPQKSVDIEGQKVNVGELNQRDMVVAIQRVKEVRTALLEQARGSLGDYAVSNIPLTITLVATSDTDRRGVSLPEGTADFLREAGVESVGLDMGPVQYSLRPEQMNQNGQPELFLVSQLANDLAGQSGPVWSRFYQEMSVGALLAIQWQDLIPQGPVYELNRRVNGQVDNAFDKPIEIGFDLKKGLSAEEANQMAIVRIDEMTGEQVLVGGQYDPLTGKISCFRDHLSKYTVVKSNKTFADVDDSWAKTEINALLNKGVIKKTDKGFEPTAKMTREELVGWIAKTYGLKEKDISLSFKDVDKSSPYYKEIAAAYELGIISGKDGQTFDPKGTVTREEVATVVMKAKKTLEGEKMVKEIEATIAKAKDKDKVSSWAKESVATATEKGILTADAGNVKPKGEVTKEEAADMIYKAYFK